MQTAIPKLNFRPTSAIKRSPHIHFYLHHAMPCMQPMLYSVCPTVFSLHTPNCYQLDKFRELHNLINTNRDPKAQLLFYMRDKAIWTYSSTSSNARPEPLQTPQTQPKRKTSLSVVISHFYHALYAYWTAIDPVSMEHAEYSMRSSKADAHYTLKKELHMSNHYTISYPTSYQSYTL